MAKTRKFYVVWKGRQPGIYLTWDECKAQVDGFVDARYKAFDSQQQAEAALQQHHTEHIAIRRADPPAPPQPRKGNFVADSICVDAACSGNPGRLEYRAVHTATGKELFRQGPYENGTNNIGEFLAIVQALAVCAQRQIAVPIYSDSKIAISWVKGKHCRTNLAPSARNAGLFRMIAKAELWLYDNTYANRILKWKTEAWGENPADFGRK